MRILFVPMPWPSHYFFMVPLAWACRSAGHEVRVAGPPALTETIRQSGITAVTIGRDCDYMKATNDYYKRLPPELREVIAEARNSDVRLELPAELKRSLRELRFAPHAKIAETMAGDLIKFVQAWMPDVVVAHPWMYAAPLAADSARIPLVRHLWGPDFPRYAGFYPGLGTVGLADGRDSWPDLLLDIYDRFEVPVRADFAVGTVDPCPTSMQLPGLPGRMPIRYVPYNGPGIVPPWLLERPELPRVCVTWGTGTTHLMGSTGFLIPDLLPALAGLRVEVVVVIKKEDGEFLGEVPAGTRVAHELPLHLLLPTCDAIIHQGGAGAMLTAAAYGVPQVIIPQAMDQHLNAERLASTGAGLISRVAPDDSGTGKIDAQDLTDAVSTILSDTSPLEAARKLCEEISGQPKPAEVADSLEALTLDSASATLR